MGYLSLSTQWPDECSLYTDQARSDMPSCRNISFFIFALMFSLNTRNEKLHTTTDKVKEGVKCVGNASLLHRQSQMFLHSAYCYVGTIHINSQTNTS